MQPNNDQALPDPHENGAENQEEHQRSTSSVSYTDQNQPIRNRSVSINHRRMRRHNPYGRPTTRNSTYQQHQSTLEEVVSLPQSNSLSNLSNVQESNIEDLYHAGEDMFQVYDPLGPSVSNVSLTTLTSTTGIQSPPLRRSANSNNIPSASDADFMEFFDVSPRFSNLVNTAVNHAENDQVVNNFPGDQLSGPTGSGTFSPGSPINNFELTSEYQNFIRISNESGISESNSYVHETPAPADSSLRTDPLRNNSRRNDSSRVQHQDSPQLRAPGPRLHSQLSLEDESSSTNLTTDSTFEEGQVPSSRVSSERDSSSNSTLYTPTRSSIPPSKKRIRRSSPVLKSKSGLNLHRNSAINSSAANSSATDSFSPTNNSYCKTCKTMLPNHKKNCADMKLVRCKYLGCRWVGRKNDQNRHADSCAYGNASGLELIQLLERTKFEAKSRLPTPDIENEIMPMFEAKKLAAIDFEIKDVHTMLSGRTSTSTHGSNSDDDNGVEVLFDLAQCLIIGQHPGQDLFPANYENSWVIYESGTASALNETISVKVNAHIASGYKIHLTYSINFHGKISTENGFNLGHLLLDGTDNAGTVIPHALGTRIYQPEVLNQVIPIHNTSNQQIVISTKPAIINFAKPISLYQLLLGKRRMGFRLFLFEDPPNADILGEDSGGFGGRVPNIPPKISSTQNSPFKEYGTSGSGSGVSFSDTSNIFRPFR